MEKSVKEKKGSCCKDATVLKTAIIKKCRKADLDPKRSAKEQIWCLYSKKNPDKLLGRHPSKDAAMEQEKAIHVRKGSTLSVVANKLRKLAYFDLNTYYADGCDAEMGDQMYYIPDASGSPIYICAGDDEEARQSVFKIVKEHGDRVGVEQDKDGSYYINLHRFVGKDDTRVVDTITFEE